MRRQSSTDFHSTKFQAANRRQRAFFSADATLLSSPSHEENVAVRFSHGRAHARAFCRRRHTGDSLWVWCWCGVLRMCGARAISTHTHTNTHTSRHATRGCAFDSSRFSAREDMGGCKTEQFVWFVFSAVFLGVCFGSLLGAASTQRFDFPSEIFSSGAHTLGARHRIPWGCPP